jgi:hypothetical protein
MKIRRKSLRGYAPAAVSEQLQQLQDNHELRLRGLKEELELLQSDNDKHRQELEAFRLLKTRQSSIPVQSTAERQAAEALLQIHKERTQALLDAQERLTAMEEEHRRELAEKQKERNELLKRVERQMRLEITGLVGMEDGE